MDGSRLTLPPAFRDGLRGEEKDKTANKSDEKIGNYLNLTETTKSIGSDDFPAVRAKSNNDNYRPHFHEIIIGPL